MREFNKLNFLLKAFRMKMIENGQIKEPYKIEKEGLKEAFIESNIKHDIIEPVDIFFDEKNYYFINWDNKVSFQIKKEIDSDEEWINEYIKENSEEINLSIALQQNDFEYIKRELDSMQNVQRLLFKLKKRKAL